MSDSDAKVITDRFGKVAFIISSDERDIPLILLDEVQAVLFKCPQPDEVTKAIKRHDTSVYDFRRAALDEQEYQGGMEGGRLYLPSRGKNKPKGLDPLFAYRRTLRSIFTNALRLDGAHDMRLAIQQSKRTEPDTIWHIDTATGMDGKTDQKRNDYIYISAAHKGYSSECIPKADAGRPTPQVSENRLRYYHPKSFDNILCSAPGGLLITKSGSFGTVHRCPQKGRGLRWWSFWQALKTDGGDRTRRYSRFDGAPGAFTDTVHAVRKGFTRKEKNALRRRLKSLQP